jgi:hypothetical protein
MEKPVETIDYKGFEIRIFNDEFIDESPRGWDNLGKMVCWHSRYTLGDEQPKCDQYEYMHSVLWGEGIFNDDILYTTKQDIKIEKKFNKIAISLPLYLYDHSGITMNTTGFSCPWDSGQVGFIYVLKKDVLKEWNKKKMTKQLYAKAVKVLKQEVEIYDQYLRGDVYGFQIIELDCDDNNLDSCWGFYGMDYCIQEAKSVADYWAKERDSGAWEKQPTGMED